MTHEVFNQVRPLADVNLFVGHRALREALEFHAPSLRTARLEALGAECGSSEMQRHARLAHRQGPVLHTHDGVGRRIDQVEFHPSYHQLMGCALRHGLHGAAWSAGPDAHLERAAAFIVFTELEPAVLCPVSMSYAVAPALRGNAAVQADWSAGLAGRHYDPRFRPWYQKSALTMGMGMTEKQGGSDLRANTSRARFDGEDAWGRRYRIEGHKWFFSAPMCDAFLVLAQAPAGPSCFFVPRWTRVGAVNGLRLQRLKDKLGNRANASSELEFDDAQAWLVGEEGRGVAQILEMGALTRLDCALGTAGLMRGALALALHHARHREAFGRRLVDQPLMRNVLADLALESEAATALAMRLAASIERSERRDALGPLAAPAGTPPGMPPAAGGLGPDHERVLRRVLTPIAKFWICKRGAAFAQEAMECLGGNGYVEADGEGVMARIYREMPLNSIWEGAGNIMALDLLRALRSGPVAEALEAELAPALGADPALDRLAASLPGRVEAIHDEGQARGLARDVALALQAALLQQHAPEPVFSAFCRGRLDAGAEVYGLLPAGVETDALIERAMPEPA